MRFKDVYINHVNRSKALIEGQQWSKQEWPYSEFNYVIFSPDKTDPLNYAEDGYWSDSIIAYDTYGDFFKYVDYHMSLGVHFLARMYRRSLDVNFSDYPEQHFWTKSFFPQAYDKLHESQTQIRDTCGDQLYLLEPYTCEAGRKCFVLYLTVPSPGGDYLVKSDNCLFTDPDFEPPHLGNFAFVEKSDDNEFPKETSVFKQQEQRLNGDPKSDSAEAQKKFQAELAAAMSPIYELLDGVLKDLAELMSDADNSAGSKDCCDVDEAKFTES